MQFARLNGVTLHYQLIGSPQSRPLIVFVNSLGTDFRMWRDVIVRLAGDFAILMYDSRGHGLSEVGETPYSMATMAADLAALLEHVEAPEAIVCGVSVGGIIAQQLYADRPDLVQALILCDTLGKIGDDASWNWRIGAIEAGGIASVSERILERWFTPEFRAPDNDEYLGYRAMLERQPAAGYVATCVALRECDLTSLAPYIQVPTICLVGDQDGSTPPAAVAAFAKSIPRARFELIRECGHLPSIEQPEMLTAIIRAFVSLVGTETVSHVSH
jgi:3-oxoadipate enol-lactonase